MNRPFSTLLPEWQHLLARLVVGIVLILGQGCSVVPRRVAVDKIGHAKRVLIYEGGKVTLERHIPENSEADQAVADWFRTHSDGWKSSIETFAPARMVQGDDFTLNFQQDRCILNYGKKGDSGWSQVVRPIEPDDPVPTIFDRNSPAPD